jgi:hypothetical protein
VNRYLLLGVARCLRHGADPVCIGSTMPHSLGDEEELRQLCPKLTLSEADPGAWGCKFWTREVRVRASD